MASPWGLGLGTLAPISLRDVSRSHVRVSDPTHVVALAFFLFVVRALVFMYSCGSSRDFRHAHPLRVCAKTFACGAPACHASHLPGSNPSPADRLPDDPHPHPPRRPPGGVGGAWPGLSGPLGRGPCQAHGSPLVLPTCSSRARGLMLCCRRRLNPLAGRTPLAEKSDANLDDGNPLEER